MEKLRLKKLGSNKKVCEMCGSTEKVFFFRRKMYLCEKHYAQMARKEKCDIRKSIKVQDLENETWEDIKGYEGLYQISNLGRVKSLPKFYQGEKILKSREDKYGYLYINLIKNKVKKSYKIHRLVAIAFISNNNNYPCVNHKDENKLNNNIDNLEWCTVTYNNRYGNRIIKAANKNRGRKNTEASKKNISIAIRKKKNKVKIGEVS